MIDDAVRPRRTPVRGRPRTGPLSWTLTAIGALALLGGSATSFGAWNATIGGAGTFRSATLLLSDTASGTSCSSSPNGAGAITTADSATCPASLLGPSAPAVTTVTPADQGSAAVTAAGLADTGTCGVQSFTDTSTADTQTGLAVGALSYAAAGPTSFSDSPTAASFAGTTGNVETLNQISGPMTFSISAWFKTSTKGVGIVGFTAAQSTTTTNRDRSLWLDGSGHLLIGVYPGFQFEVSSSATTTRNFADGAWHHVVATVAPVSSSVGTVLLYADGALVGGSTGDETGIGGSNTAEVNSGWWHVGFADTSGWANAASSLFFSGSLADVAVFPTALGATQVAALAAEPTQAATAAQVAALAPTSSWPLQDDGTGTYTGPIANVPTNPTVTFRDASGNPGTDLGTASGTVTSQAAGPLSGRAASFDGSTGYIQTASALTGPMTFSLSLWFNSSTAGSSIVGFTNSPSSSGAGNWDRNLWLDGSGHLVFGVFPGSTFIVNSSATTTRNYADGSWHHVVATVAPVSSTVGTVELYADGVLVAGSPGNETGISGSNTAQVYGGWWHLGYGNTSSWPNAPAHDHLAGSLAGVAVIPTALSASQVASLTGSATQAAYDAAVVGGVATSGQFWPLEDNPSVSPACTYLAVTVGTGTSCLVPASTFPCPAKMSAGIAAQSATLPASLPALTVTTTIVGTRPAGAALLHVLVPWRLTASGGGFTSTLDHRVGAVML